MKNNIKSLLNRRTFIRNTVVAAAGLTVTSSFALSTSSKNKFESDKDFGFLHGVASFDPAQDQIILWSRYTPLANEVNNPEIMLDVALSEDFSKGIVASEKVALDPDNDNTIIVDVENLKPNTIYFYRFRNEKTGVTSVIGQTKTLPIKGQLSNVKMAVVSCANYQVGYFNVYGAVAKSDVDVVVHMGDYIYEYGVGDYGTTEDTKRLNREHLPAGEILKIEDYRQRYQQYRSDPQLQEAHRQKPFICVWDDHEICNDAYKEGAQNHQEEEGDFQNRKAIALQVWHEYLPARVEENSKIYRTFDFGGIVNLLMLDTRIIGRDKQISYANFMDENGFDVDKFVAAWTDESRSMLGEEQKNWLVDQVNKSEASWNVLGSQVLMGKYQIPAELLTIIAEFIKGGNSEELLNAYQELLTDLVNIKTRMLKSDPSLTEEEIARVENVLPYNLDAWDGYPVERAELLARINGKKIISIAGDTHNAWYAKLTDSEGNKVGAEFAAPGVSSPGLESLFGTDPKVIGEFEQANQLLINDLNYVDASRRGFLEVTFSVEEAKADWKFVKTLSTENTDVVVGNSAVEI